MNANDVIDLLTENARRDTHPRVLALAGRLTADDIADYVSKRPGLTINGVLASDLQRIDAARRIYADRPLRPQPAPTFAAGMLGGMQVIASAFSRENNVRKAREALMTARSCFALKNRRGVLISLDRAASCRRAAAKAAF